MIVDERYQRALDYLYSFVDFSMSRARYSPDQFDLGRMRQLMHRLGDPQQAFPSIHIAGTKGKGSVSALCASALRAAGYRVGLYTSPHLEDYTERIQVDGKPIDPGELADLVDEFKGDIEGVAQITTFEITTALAFIYFARRGVQAAVIEVGLGGRLDATNVIVPSVTVITSLSIDHTFLLGNTLAEIAAEKAGIVKPGVPLVLAPQAEEACQVVERIAAEREAPIIRVGEDVGFSAGAFSLEGQEFRVWSRAGGDGKSPEYDLSLRIPLLGRHQVENAATAFAALQQFNQAALPVSDAAIQTGFAQVSWPARFEILQQEPAVIVDSAHNRDSAMKLRQTLDDFFPNREIVLIFGASEDKDIEGMFAELLPRVRDVIFTKSFHPRAADPDRLVELANNFGKPNRVVPDVVDALEAGLTAAQPDAVLLAAGSIFIAAGIREAWFRRK